MDAGGEDAVHDGKCQEGVAAGYGGPAVDQETCGEDRGNEGVEGSKVAVC